jgi:hypothetical protein
MEKNADSNTRISGPSAMRLAGPQAILAFGFFDKEA